MKIDLTTNEYYMDVDLSYETLEAELRNPFIILQISLQQWPDVTPVIQLMQPSILCPAQHSSISVLGTPKPSLLEYDVT